MLCVCCLRSGCFGGNLGGTWAKAWSLARTTDSALPRKTLTWNELKHRRAGMLQRHPSKYEVSISKYLLQKGHSSYGCSTFWPFTWKENSANGYWNKRDDDVMWMWVVVSLETERAIGHSFYWSWFLLIAISIDHDFYWYVFIILQSPFPDSNDETLGECLQVLDSCHNVS